MRLDFVLTTTHNTQVNRHVCQKKTLKRTPLPHLELGFQSLGKLASLVDGGGGS